jgi:predicted aconitase with swiveling domain
MKTFLKCHRIIGGYGEGEALISHEPICFYLTDPKTGIVREKTHELAGQNISNKVLVFPSGKASSVVQIDGLFKLASHNLAPKAMIVKDVETVLIVSAFMAKVPLVDRLEKDPFKVIGTGDMVRVDADNGAVTVERHSLQHSHAKALHYTAQSF